MGKAERWFVYILVYLFLSGLIAHLVPKIYPFTRYTTDLFLLMINGTLLYFLFEKNKDQNIWWWAAITYLGTFSLEAIGVATGKVFGAYHYGETMFLQVLNVPLVIALNWTVLILAVNNLMYRWTQRPILLAILSGLFIAVYDYFIEPVAIRLDYWQWEAAEIPLQNYLAWAVIAFLFSLPLHLWKIKFRSPLLNIYLFVQLIYFILLNLLL
ncbi:MAG: carotenoid biosynthesis protein [Saprospiraceae bacterium]|nr:carotenoid biosynthesis protein [Saprospiraceae bacterium]